MVEPAQALLYLQIAIAVASAICAAFLIRKALSFHQKLWLGIVVLLLSTIALSLLAVHIPLFFLSESSRIQHHLTADIMMFGAAGLILTAIIGFAIDHMSEKPNWLMVSAGASIAIGLFPFIYRFNQDTFNEQYQITIVEPEQPKKSLNSLLNPESSGEVPEEDATPVKPEQP